MTAVTGDAGVQQIITKLRRVLEILLLTGQGIEVQKTERKLGIGGRVMKLFDKPLPSSGTKNFRQKDRGNERYTQSAILVVNLPRPESIQRAPNIIRVVAFGTFPPQPPN